MNEISLSELSCKVCFPPKSLKRNFIMLYIYMYACVCLNALVLVQVMINVILAGMNISLDNAEKNFPNSLELGEIGASSPHDGGALFESLLKVSVMIQSTSDFLWKSVHVSDKLRLEAFRLALDFFYVVNRQEKEFFQLSALENCVLPCVLNLAIFGKDKELCELARKLLVHLLYNNSRTERSLRSVVLCYGQATI